MFIVTINYTLRIGNSSISCVKITLQASGALYFWTYRWLVLMIIEVITNTDSNINTSNNISTIVRLGNIIST